MREALQSSSASLMERDSHEMQSIDKRRVRADFDRAASDYAYGAGLQRNVAQTLVREALKTGVIGDKGQIADIGCGTGFIGQQLRQQGAAGEVVQCDIAYGMCCEARRHNPALPVIQADIEALPLADASQDAILSSLAWQWLPEPGKGWSELARALKPSGSFLISSFGPGTLRELRTAFILAEGEGSRRVHSFYSPSALQQQAQEAGLRDVRVTMKIITLYQPDMRRVMRLTRSIGASAKPQQRQSQCSPRSLFISAANHYRSLYGTEKGLPVSWEVLMVQGEKPQ